MDFISNKKPQIEAMLASMGVSSLDELWSHIPKEILQKAPTIDDGISEYEGLKELTEISKKNTHLDLKSYIGAGAYAHYVPAIVRSIIGKSGFLTAYTPYQAEASQGLLQTIFEFQTTISRLTGLEMANASLYDASSACAEAMLMALRIQSDRKKVVIAQNLHPHYQKVIEQYLKPIGIEIELLKIKENGMLDVSQAETLFDESVAGVLFAYPTFFGNVENLKPLIAKAKEKDIIVAICANPLAYGMYQSAGELEADIAIGDCQPFGIPLQLGGPYAGYMSCKKKYARQIPGRIVGKTEDLEGNKGFVLTLQTREQHIRREKATSNICSNQALFALASLVAMLWYGPQGIKKLALTNFQRATYLKTELLKLPKVFALNQAPTFNEFVIKTKVSIKDVLNHFRENKIEPGLSLESFYPNFKDHLLINVTEMKDERDLDHYLEVAKKIFE